MKALEHIHSHKRSEEFKTLLFWHGPLSQWWYSSFVVDDVEYNCAEQYMMAMKARMFGDDEVLAKIMKADGPHTSQQEFTQYPRAQKKLGREVRNFCPVAWHAVARDVVTRANIAKFAQNDKLMVALILTQGYTLVEASPYDPLWGIGLSEESEIAFNPAMWKGKNWLGQVLTELRNSVIII